MIEQTLPSFRSAPGARRWPTTAAMRGVLSAGQVGLSLLALGIVGSLLAPDFLTVGNIRNLLSQTSILGVLALSQFLVVLIGGFDLSVAAILALSSVLVAKILPGYGLVLSSIAGLAAGTALGALSGVAATVGRVPPMIATLAVAGMARGLALAVAPKSVLAPDRIIHPLHWTFGILTTTTAAWLVLAAVMAFLLARTRPGRHLYAIGGNERAARLAGIPVLGLQITAYAASGMLAGLGGALFVVRTFSGVPLVGSGWELETIAGIVIGGTRLFGGEGTVLKAMAGMVIYLMIGNIMNLVALNPYYQDVAKAAVIVAVVGVSILQARRRRVRS